MNLVPFTQQHFDQLLSWFTTEADVVQWAGPTISFPVSHHELQAMIDEGEASPPQRLCWMVEHNGQVIGHAQLRFEWRNGNAALCRIAIAPDKRGCGLAHPMLKLVLKTVFGWPEIQRAELHVYPFNKSAIRAYERQGFVHEGIRRSSAKVGNERWDTAIIRILRSDWETKF